MMPHQALRKVLHEYAERALRMFSLLCCVGAMWQSRTRQSIRYSCFKTSTMYMYRFMLLGGLWFICSSGQMRPSTKLLSRDQMVSILVDLELIKAAVAHYTDDTSAASLLLQKNMPLICQSHNIDINIFQESYQYYLADSKTMQEIYALVIGQIEEISGQL